MSYDNVFWIMFRWYLGCLDWMALFGWLGILVGWSLEWSRWCLVF